MGKYLPGFIHGACLAHNHHFFMDCQKITHILPGKRLIIHDDDT